MKLVIGLGNPGKKFKNNRHNVGHIFVGYLRSKIKDQNKDLNLKLEKTNVFMNESGDFVKKATRTYHLEPSNLFVVHDDLDLPLGQWKIQLGIGPKIHYGVNSIEEALGSKNFWRIRIGVDNRDPNNRISGDEYVLQDFTKEETEILKGVFGAILKDNSFPR